MKYLKVTLLLSRLNNLLLRNMNTSEAELHNNDVSSFKTGSVGTGRRNILRYNIVAYEHKLIIYLVFLFYLNMSMEFT